MSRSDETACSLVVKTPGLTRPENLLYEIVMNKMNSPKGFPGAVLREYHKNIVMLPDP